MQIPRRLGTQSGGGQVCDLQASSVAHQRIALDKSGTAPCPAVRQVCECCSDGRRALHRPAICWTSRGNLALVLSEARPGSVISAFSRIPVAPAFGSALFPAGVDCAADQADVPGAPGIGQSAVAVGSSYFLPLQKKRPLQQQLLFSHRHSA